MEPTKSTVDEEPTDDIDHQPGGTSDNTNSEESEESLSIGSILDSIGLNREISVKSLEMFPIEHYKKGKKKLGRGAFGTVRVYEKKTGFNRLFTDNFTMNKLPEKVAVKKLKGCVGTDSQLRKEVHVLQESNHQHIVEFFGYFSVDDDTTGIAMELCDGTVKDLVKARDLNHMEVAYLTLQMLKGVEYLHDKLRVHHRDIKPENMLLKTIDGSDVSDWTKVNVGNLILKISDFGLCRQLSESRASESIVMTVVGTLNWLAPEIKAAMVLDGLKETSYSKYSDIWACGCVVYYMFKKKPPDNNNVANECEVLQTDDSLKEFLFLDFLLCMIQSDRKKRSSAKCLLEHPFLTLPLKVRLLEAQTSANFEPLKDFCLFTSTENLKSYVEAIKSELQWNDDKVVSFLLNERFEGAISIIGDLLNENAVLAAILLLKDGEIDAQDEYIKSWLKKALCKAAERGEITKVKMLCESGAIVNRESYNDNSPLESACYAGHYSTVEYLIKEQNADVNSATDYIYSVAPLQIAALKEHSDIVKLLCESGAKVNAKSNCIIINGKPTGGDTALYGASAHGYVSTVKVLLDMGARKNIKDVNGKTARDVAGSGVPKNDKGKLKEIKAFWDHN